MSNLRVATSDNRRVFSEFSSPGQCAVLSDAQRGALDAVEELCFEACSSMDGIHGLCHELGVRSSDVTAAERIMLKFVADLGLFRDRCRAAAVAHRRGLRLGAARR
jgi:hypothetical protein